MDIEFLLFLQQLREALGGQAEAFMNIVTELPFNPIVLLIPCLLYWCIDKDRGIFVLFNVGVGALCNQILKVGFCVYRPWVRDTRIHPSLAALPRATGYSFPSGHTQVMASTFGSMAWTYRKRSRAVVGVCTFLILLVGFSRNILGVHTPQDVVVGIVEASLVLWLVTQLFRWMLKHPEKDYRILVVGLLFVVGALAYTQIKSYPIEFTPAGNLLVDPKEMKLDSFQAAGALSGILISWFAEKRLIAFSTNCELRFKVIRFICGAAMVALAYYVGIPLFEMFASAELAEFMHGFLLMYAGVFAGPALGEFVSGIGRSDIEGAKHLQR